ncbi:hypothetical protein LTR85_004762 [Meristemomyces frigidus]|nr:hypothetical protein LTR85_004762 [Meristemomyces frigidus]
MESAKFKTVAQSLLKDSTFADFVIKCGWKEYKVHRFILSCHSDYFKKCFEGKFLESESRIIEVHEDDAEAVELMIGYFYAFDYSDEPKPEAKLKNSTLVNAVVYAIADKYEITDLKPLAMKKFGVSLGRACDKGQEFPLPWSCMWVLGAIAVDTPEAKQASLDFVQRVPQFGADIAVKLAEMTAKAGMTARCSCHPSCFDSVPKAGEALKHG